MGSRWMIVGLLLAGCPQTSGVTDFSTADLSVADLAQGDLTDLAVSDLTGDFSVGDLTENDFAVDCHPLQQGPCMAEPACKPLLCVPPFQCLNPLRFPAFVSCLNSDEPAVCSMPCDGGP
jgi:hypothetical protein